MKTQIMIAMALIAMVGLTHATAEEAKKAAPPEAPKGYVIVEEDVWVYFVDAPEEHFQKARVSFLKKEYKAAASEIHRAAAMVSLEAARAKGKTKDALTASAKELHTLATKIETGSVKDVHEMNAAVARAHQALAQHHYLKASESWAKKETQKAGHEMKAAMTHVENALAWSGHKIEAGWDATVNGIREVSAKMIKGPGWVAKEVGKALESTGREVDKLAAKIEPAKPAIAAPAASVVPKKK